MRYSRTFKGYSEKEQTTSVKVLISIGLLILLLVLLLTSALVIGRGKPQQNELAVGENAKIAGKIDIKLVQAATFSGLTLKEILDLRKSVVAQNSMLLNQPYAPYRPIFESLIDKLPWFSFKNYYYYGREKGPNDGPSMESKTILNPFLLAGAEIWGIGVWPKDGIKWNKALITEEVLSKPDFPYYCKPSSLIWQPESKQAAVSYPLKSYISEVNRYLVTPIKNQQLSFRLVALNALDFGYNYATVDFGKSSNIEAHDAKGKFIHLTDVYGTQKNYCPGDGLCNLMSPSIPELRKVNITSLPARLRLDLWKNMPTVDNQKADFYYDIFFE